MIIKQKKVSYDRKEVCRNCKGSGIVPMGELDTVCPVCQGYGLVNKHIDVEITIKPHNNDHCR